MMAPLTQHIDRLSMTSSIMSMQKKLTIALRLLSNDVIFTYNLILKHEN